MSRDMAQNPKSECEQVPAQSMDGRYWELAAVICVSLFAFALRVWDLGVVPYGPLGDEATYALRSKWISEGHHIGIWNPDTLGVPSGHAWVMAFFFKLGGPTLFTARFLSAVVGTLLVPLCFYTLRMHFCFKVAFTAAFLLATFSWLVVASRLGMPSMLSVFSTVLALCVLMYALRISSNVAALAAGLFMGVSAYVFTLNFFFLVGVSSFVVLVLVVNSDLRRRSTLYLFLVSAWMVAFPMAHYYVTHQEQIRGTLSVLYHVESASIWDVSEHVKRFWEIVLHVHRGADVRHMPVDALEPRAILPGPLGGFFWVGLLVALLGLWKVRYNMLLMGWLVSMPPAILVPGGDTRRYLLGAVFLLIIAAVGFHSFVTRVAGWLAPSSERVRSALTVCCMVAFLSSFAAVNVYDLTKWPESEQAGFLYTHELRRVSEFLDEVDPAYDVRFYSARWSVNIEAVRWLAPDLVARDGSTEFGGDGTIFSGGEPTERTMYVLLDGYWHLRAELMTNFPEGAYIEDVGQDGKINFIAFVTR